MKIDIMNDMDITVYIHIANIIMSGFSIVLSLSIIDYHTHSDHNG